MLNVNRILIIFALIFTYSYAKPAKNETFDFIKKKSSFNKIDNWGTNIKNSLSSSKDQCTLIITGGIYPNNYYGNAQYASQQIVDLREIDPNEIKANESQGYYMVEFMIRENRSLIKNKQTYSDYHMKKYPKDEHIRSYNRSSGSIAVSNRRDGKKVAKALIHLVSLCGGKSELF